MIVALYQCPEPSSLSEGLRMVETALAQAAQGGAEMLVLPETVLPGYTQVTPAPPDGWDGVEDRLAALCRRYGKALTLGLPLYEGGQVFNTALALGANGEMLARYRKVQLFGPEEAALYTRGDAYVTFDYRGTRFGLLICYDVEFPEHVRALARRGVEVVLVPTANMMPFANVNSLIVPARAAENALTIVYANYCGTAADLSYTGLSTIAGPDGYALGLKGHGPGLCIAELPKPGWSEHDVPLSTQLRDLITL